MKQSTEKLWAMAAHFGMAITGLTGLGALVLYFVFKDKSKYIAHHAYQSMWFFFCVWILGFLISILPLGFLSVPLAVALVVATLVFTGIASFKALKGEWYEYPLTSKIARRAIH